MVHLPQFETYLRSGVKLDDHDLQAGLHREGHDDQDPQGQGTPAQRPLPSTRGEALALRQELTHRSALDGVMGS